MCSNFHCSNYSKQETIQVKVSYNFKIAKFIFQQKQVDILISKNQALQILYLKH